MRYILFLVVIHTHVHVCMLGIGRTTCASTPPHSQNLWGYLWMFLNFKWPPYELEDFNPFPDHSFYIFDPFSELRYFSDLWIFWVSYLAVWKDSGPSGFFGWPVVQRKITKKYSLCAWKWWKPYDQRWLGWVKYLNFVCIEQNPPCKEFALIKEELSNFRTCNNPLLHVLLHGAPSQMWLSHTLNAWSKISRWPTFQAGHY
jgi:hypothetical protein